MVLDDAQRLCLENIFLVCVSGTAVDSACRGVICPKIDTGTMFRGVLRVASIDTAASLPSRKIVVFVMEIH